MWCNRMGLMEDGDGMDAEAFLILTGIPTMLMARGNLWLTTVGAVMAVGPLLKEPVKELMKYAEEPMRRMMAMIGQKHP